MLFVLGESVGGVENFVPSTCFFLFDFRCKRQCSMNECEEEAGDFVFWLVWNELLLFFLLLLYFSLLRGYACERSVFLVFFFKGVCFERGRDEREDGGLGGMDSWVDELEWHK